MPALCAPKFETVDYVHTARVGPTRIPLGVLAPLWGHAAWVAYWYTYHDGCMVNRCPCWAAARRGHGAQWHGDGLAIIGPLPSAGPAVRALAVSLSHGEEGLPPLNLRELLRAPTNVTRAEVGGVDRGRPLTVGLQRIPITTAFRAGAATTTRTAALQRRQRAATVHAALALLPGLEDAERAALEPLYATVWPAADTIRAFMRARRDDDGDERASPPRRNPVQTGALLSRRKTSR